MDILNPQNYEELRSNSNICKCFNQVIIHHYRTKMILLNEDDELR